jgi:hypothetical protein
MTLVVGDWWLVTGGGLFYIEIPITIDFFPTSKDDREPKKKNNYFSKQHRH